MMWKHRRCKGRKEARIWTYKSSHMDVVGSQPQALWVQNTSNSRSQDAEMGSVLRQVSKATERTREQEAENNYMECANSTEEQH